MYYFWPMADQSMSSQLLDDFFRRRILLHVLFWAAVIGFNVMVYHHDNERYTHTLRTTLGFLPGHMIFVYGLIYWCMPRFVFPGNWAGTVASFLLVLFVSLTYLKVADVYLLHYSGRRSMVEHVGEALPRSLLALLSTGGPAVSIYLIKVWYQEKETRQRLNEERLMAELSSLKAQLQPHFLFNTLNNIYAMDYLEKPFSLERFIKAINKLGRSNAEVTSEVLSTPGSAFVYFRSDRKMVKVFLDDIVYIESLKDYVKVVRLSEKPLVVKKSIHSVQEMLPDKRFIRVHRSFIVSVQQIRAFTQTDIEISGLEIPIGKLYGREIAERLRQLSKNC
jgi:hypothetical protein